MLGLEFLKSLSARKYSKFCDLIVKHGDADSLLIAKYALENLR